MVSGSDDKTLRTADIIESESAKTFFNDILINQLYILEQTTTLPIQSKLEAIVNQLHTKYSIDVSLFSDISFVLMNVLSDCIGYISYIIIFKITSSSHFDAYYPSWKGLFSKEVLLFVNLNCTL